MADSRAPLQAAAGLLAAPAAPARNRVGAAKAVRRSGISRVKRRV